MNMSIGEVTTDPTELHNLADQYPERVRSMEKAWQAWMESSELQEKKM